MNIRPTDSADPVAVKTRIPAARSVRAVPLVETSWADQSSRKSRLRKTEKVPGGEAATSPAGPAGGSLVALAASVTLGPSPRPDPGAPPHLVSLGRPSVPKASAPDEADRQPDALEGEELALDVEQRLARAEPGTAVAADRSVARDHPMARDRQSDRVAPDRAAGGAGGAGP